MLACGMPQSPSPREAARLALGEPVRAWIERHRASAARLSYGQMARVLREEYGIEVWPQTVRFWHLTPEPEQPEPNGDPEVGAA